MKSGEFNAARVCYQWVIKFWPDELDGYFALSALSYKQNDQISARNYLREGILRRPHKTFVAPTGGAAHMLRLRGVQNSVYLIGKSRNGDYKTKMRGGNFEDRYLMSYQNITVTSYFIVDDNILSDRTIPPFDMVLTLVADPDVEKRSLETLCAFLTRYPDIPVINRPEAVLRTTRDQNYQRLNGIDGLCFPKTVRFDAADAAIEDAIGFMKRHDFGFPLLLRETGTHNGKSFKKIETIETFADYISHSQTAEVYVIEYVNNLFRGDTFRKMRVFFIDGVPYPAICHFDTLWNVHGSNRTETMLRHQWMVDEEKAFMGDCQNYLGDGPFARLMTMPEIIGLDFFGVDFTVLENGTVLLFEVNPAMRHSFDHAENFPYLLPYLETISKAFQKMGTDKLENQVRVKSE